LSPFALILQDESAKEAAKLIFETALLESGFVLEDPKDFATRIYSVIKSNLNVSPDAEVDVDDDDDDDDTEDEVEKEEADMDFEIASEDKNDNPQFNLHEVIL
jgi:heat shock protein beta